MQYKQINVNSVLNKITSKDRLFIGDCTIDPYQNCEFGCLYCDSSFEKTIYVKSNAAEVLKEKIGKQNKGRIIVGSVHDPYQKIEKDCKLTRRILEIIHESNFSCHILTKSDLVLRDIDILSKIDDCVVTMSVISLDDFASSVFEKNVPTTAKRLEVMKKLNDNGIKSGIAIMPVLPFIVDEELEKIVSSAKEHNAQYVLHKYLELKGDQKNIFIDILRKFYPNFVEKYTGLYKNSYMPSDSYVSKLNKKMIDLSNKYDLKKEV